MGLIFGIITRLIKWTLYFVVFASVIILIPNLPPYTKFTSIQLEPTLPRVGPLAPNSALNNVEKLYKDKVVGPEAFELHNGELYTSLGTGEIVKLSTGGHVTFVTKIGPPCTGLTQEHICGRPLGFQIDGKQNKMYVADAYHGIWRVDLKTDKKQLLVSPRVEIEGRAPKLFNFIALDKNGDLYWTDSSSDFQLKDGVYTSCVDPSGRLFHYNAAKNQSKVLLDDLWFPNGVVISPDNQFLVISETFRYRLLKYYISGPKKGQSEVFIGGLPGTPDNLRALPDGSGLLVPLYVAFDAESPLLTRSLAAAPVVRKLLARALAIAEAPFQFMLQHFPHPVVEDIVYKIGNFKGMSAIAPGECGFVHLDWEGRVLGAFYNNDGSMPKISDAIVFNDKLYLGNPHEEHVAAIPAPPSLKKAFAANVEPKAEKKEAPKPVKVPEKPKIEVKQAPPKQEPKPVPTKAPQPAKPAPKPVEIKPKPQEVPKPAQPKPTPPPKKVETPKAEQKPPTPKPAETKPKSAPKPETKPAAPKTETPAAKPKPSEAKKPEGKPQKEKEAKPAKAIPIKEEIPSDTAKPNKETLKVIKKDGPAEIPNPNLV